MNMSPRWMPLLEAAGHEVFHWSQIGRPDATDAEILLRASTDQAVIISHDLDFGSILAASGGRAPSVVLLRTDNLDVALIGEQVLVALRQLREALDAGALVAIDPKRTRIRMLPLRRPDS